MGGRRKKEGEEEKLVKTQCLSCKDIYLSKCSSKSIVLSIYIVKCEELRRASETEERNEPSIIF